MMMTIAFICFLAGIGIGFLGGMLGIGGGMIAIPSFGLLLNMDQQMAQGTALILVVPTVLISLRKYTQHTPIDWKVAGSGAASTLAFSSVGAHLALGLNPLLLRKSFAIFLFCLAIFYIWCIYRKQPDTLKPRFNFGRIHALFLGVMAGLLGGFFGVGGCNFGHTHHDNLVRSTTNCCAIYRHHNDDPRFVHCTSAVYACGSSRLVGRCPDRPGQRVVCPNGGAGSIATS